MGAQQNADLHPLFQFRHVHAAIQDFVTNTGSSDLKAAWGLVQEVIKAHARFYAAQGRWDEDVSTAKAWEDFEMACRGKAPPPMTGAILFLWGEVPPNRNPAFVKTLDQGFKAAHAVTDPRYLRYAESDRLAPLHTMDDDFADAEAVPTDRPIPKGAAPKPNPIPATQPRPTPADVKTAVRAFTVIPGGRDGN